MFFAGQRGSEFISADYCIQIVTGCTTPTVNDVIVSQSSIIYTEYKRRRNTFEYTVRIAVTFFSGPLGLSSSTCINTCCRAPSRRIINICSIKLAPSIRSHYTSRFRASFLRQNIVQEQTFEICSCKDARLMIGIMADLGNLHACIARFQCNCYIILLFLCVPDKSTTIISNIRISSCHLLVQRHSQTVIICLINAQIILLFIFTAVDIHFNATGSNHIRKRNTIFGHGIHFVFSQRNGLRSRFIGRNRVQHHGSRFNFNRSRVACCTRSFSGSCNTCTPTSTHVVNNFRHVQLHTDSCSAFSGLSRDDLVVITTSSKRKSSC